MNITIVDLFVRLLSVIGVIIALINISICFIMIKRKHNKILLGISIAGIVLDFIIRSMWTPASSSDGFNTTVDVMNNIYNILQPFNFVIQIIVFVLLIINIVKNKKKEEP